MSNVLVIAEHVHGKYPKTTLVALAAGKVLAAKDGGKVTGAVFGQGVDGLASELAEYGVDVTPKVKIVKLETPPKRSAGRKVETVQELVKLLHDEAKAI